MRAQNLINIEVKISYRTMVDKKVTKKKKVDKTKSKVVKSKTSIPKDRRRKRRSKRKNSHQCYYKVKGRYMTPRQAAKHRRKKRFGKPG